MKLWKISQDENDGYDTFDSAVVAAETESDARDTLPADWARPGDSWAKPEGVKVEYLGEAKDGTAAGVICASFNAG